MKIRILTKDNRYFSALWASSIGRNISKVYGGDVLSKIISLGTALLLIRGLSVTDYAAYTAFNTVLYLIPGFLGGGINSALIRFSAEHISRTGRNPFELYFINFIFQLVIYCVCFLVLFLSIDSVTNLLFGGYSFDSALVYGLIAGLGFLMAEAGRGVYRAEEKFGKYVKTLWLRQILVFVIISLLFLVKQLNFQRSAQAIIIAELFVAAVITSNIFGGFSFGHFRQVLKRHSGLIRDFISSSSWLIIYSFVLTCFSSLDIFMLSHFSAKEEIANYGVAFRFYALGLLLLGSIHAVLLTEFSKIEMQDADKQRQFMWKWLKVIGWTIVPIIFADAFSKPLFIWMVGAQYEKAFFIFVIFSFGVWLSLTFSPLVNILISRKAFKFLVVLAVGAFTINFTGNYLLIPIWGGLGAAFVTILSHAFINIISAIKVMLSTK